MNAKQVPNLNMISLNCRGLSNVKKRKSIFSWCKKQKGDIIFLQETHSTEKAEKEWKINWGGEIFFSNGKSNKRGVTILIKKGLDFEEEKVITDSRGRIIIIRAKIQGAPLVLANIYAPNKDKELVDFYRSMRISVT